jgi:hypothetical protein
MSLFLFAVQSRAAFNPYRVLLVIGDQWADPRSFLVDTDESIYRYDFTVRPKGTDFKQLVVMLKSWGMPFDILRLDQEMLNINRFLKSDGSPRYGCIVWAADPRNEYPVRQNYAILDKAVREAGISLVALSNRIGNPVLENLLGVKLNGYHKTNDPMLAERKHFLLDGLPEQLTNTGIPYQHHAEVTVHQDVLVLARSGNSPALVVGRAGKGRTVWIGGDADVMFESQPVRTLLRRAIVFGTGYALYKTWENHKIMSLDDPGTAQSAWLDHWSYPALTRGQINRHLIEPLKAHNALLVINVVPGFVNDSTRRVELAFQRDFVDRFGNRQNHRSTRLGIEDGLAAGVFEVQSHGWTHMQPDLDSPPGPWWGADIKGEKAEVGWYREFGDTRRGDREMLDIPAAQQRFQMWMSSEWIEDLFGVTPLAILPGGRGFSTGYNQHTSILAAKTGFGWLRAYLGPDMAVHGWLFEGTLDAPGELRALPDSHDKGIVEHPERFLETFEVGGPEAIYIGYNEYVGYMHAGWESEAGNSPELTLTYDGHYCAHFSSRQSSWTLHIADWALMELRGRKIVVDSESGGEVTADGIQTVKIPAGCGEHTITIE